MLQQFNTKRCILRDGWVSERLGPRGWLLRKTRSCGSLGLHMYSRLTICGGYVGRPKQVPTDRRFGQTFTMYRLAIYDRLGKFSFVTVAHIRGSLGLLQGIVRINICANKTFGWIDYNFWIYMEYLSFLRERHVFIKYYLDLTILGE